MLAACLAAVGAGGVGARAEAAVPDAVALRGRTDVVRGVIESVDAQAIQMKLPAPGTDDVSAPGARTVLLSWDLVREAAGPRAAEVAAARARGPGEDLWRARSRAARGDGPMAEALLAGVYSGGRTDGGRAGGDRWGELARGRGPTSWVLHEVVLRSRLARGWQSGSVLPWLAWLASERVRRREASAWELVGSVPDSQATGGAFLDPATGLCAALPPIFSREVSPRGVAAMLASEEWAVASAAWAGDGAVTELAELYKLAAAAEQADLAAPEASLVMPPSASAESAVLLVRDIVAARVGDPATRAAARESLERRLSDVVGRPARPSGNGVAGDAAGPGAGWLEAWLRVGLGRSMLREADEVVRRRGVVMLLHVPARLGEANRPLAALALLEAASEIARTGDRAAADRLRAQARSLAQLADDGPEPREAGQRSSPGGAATQPAR